MFRTSRVGRYINQNLFNVIIVIILITFIIIMVQAMNNIEKKNRQNNNTAEQNTVAEHVYTPQDTVISGITVNEEYSKINESIIDNFIKLCNNKDTQEAYNLLSNECKKIYFPTLNAFENNYYSKVFNTKKTYSIQSWINNDKYTYKIKIFEDMLSTGIYDNSNIIEDYYTIVESEETKKLNINGYIGRKEENYTKEQNLINVSLKYKDMYKEYEVYYFEVKNNSENIIAMDSKQTTSGTYLIGENNTKYSSYIHEINIEDLIIESGRTGNFSIKFNKQYNPNRKINGVVFSDIILNYNEYLEKENKDEYKERAKIQLY